MKPVWPVAITLSVMVHAALFTWLPGRTPTHEQASTSAVLLDLTTTKPDNDSAVVTDNVFSELQRLPLPNKQVDPNPKSAVTPSPQVSEESPVVVAKPEQVTPTEPPAEQEQVDSVETAVNPIAPFRDPNLSSPESKVSEQEAESIDIQHLQQDIKAWLQQALSEQLLYPPSARRRGWEDSVEVLIEMQTDGVFTADILIPARRNIFNEAALAALAHISANSRYCCTNAIIQLELTIGFQLD